MAFTEAVFIIVNHAVKVVMIKYRIPIAVAEKPVDSMPRIAIRAYELY
jgi:hypothetical protein